VNRRLESQDGISFTEFSYLVLQAYDFLQLFDRYGCTLQMGGSDQWGNITAGIDLIRKLRATKAHGLVWPLMKTSSGAKFGKTEAGTIWLDPERTSPFKFFQFWLNTDDRDAVSYLKFFTFLDQPSVEQLAALVSSAPEKREAQRVLAREVTALVHGAEASSAALEASLASFDPTHNLDPAALAALEDELPTTRLAADSPPVGVLELLVSAGLAASKSAARRLVEQGGVYVNEGKIDDPDAVLGSHSRIGGRWILLRAGKRRRHLVVFDDIGQHS
jgi:tyrosyl-tRNA synthetase